MVEEDSRSFADERHRLLHELEVERNQLIRNIETCRIRDIDRPLIGDWSLKDIVGHVATWEAEAVAAFRELREGKRPKLFDFDEGRIDEWNQDHVERKRALNFWDVLQQLKSGRERLIEELAQLEDEDIGTEGSVHARLIRSVIEHDREHWHHIAARLAGMAGARPGAHNIPHDATATN